MIEKPEIVHTSDQATAFIHLSVPREKVMELMGPAVAEVLAAVQAQGIRPSGPWFTHHLKRPTHVFDMEVCVPVSKAFTTAGRVKAGKIAAVKVARAVYHGPYDGLGAAWGEFITWIEAEKLKTRTDLWECYTVGPNSTSDPDEYRTELNMPLAHA